MAEDDKLGTIMLSYLGIFFGIWFLQFLLDLNGIFDERVRNLSRSAFKNFLKRECFNRTRSQSIANNETFDMEKALKDSSDFASATEESVRTESSDQSRSKKVFLKLLCCHFPREPYNFDFFQWLIKRPCYYGCDPIWFPHLENAKGCFRTFPPGLMVCVT